MSKRERLIKTLETEQGTIVEVKVDYRLGGMNYFTGNLVERGIYLSVTPVRINKSSCGKYTTRLYTAFTGIVQVLKFMTRFNNNVFDNLHPDEELIEKMVKIVAQKNNLTYIAQK